jgi:hypothetical protein
MREFEPSCIACALSQPSEETLTGCVQLSRSEERYLRETTLSDGEDGENNGREGVDENRSLDGFGCGARVHVACQENR